MSGTSYDPRMEQHPVFISYPRSGSHWLNGLMELYFDRPRLRHGPASWHPNRTDYMWFHDHDIKSDLKLSHNNIMYLYRDPKDVIFSILKAEHEEVTHDLVTEQVRLIDKHSNKYLGMAKCIVSYEGMKRDLPNEFKKVCEWLQKPFDQNKIEKVSQQITKQKIINKAVDKRYFNKEMLRDKYKMEREDFKSIFGHSIDTALPWMI